jgi:hypothetical protein
MEGTCKLHEFRKYPYKKSLGILHRIKIGLCVGGFTYLACPNTLIKRQYQSNSHSYRSPVDALHLKCAHRDGPICKGTLGLKSTGAITSLPALSPYSGLESDLPEASLISLDGKMDLNYPNAKPNKDNPKHYSTTAIQRSINYNTTSPIRTTSGS